MATRQQLGSQKTKSQQPKSQPGHLRLPQQSDEVIGSKAKPGETSAPGAAPDPRTKTQDPALKPKKLP